MIWRPVLAAVTVALLWLVGQLTTTEPVLELDDPVGGTVIVLPVPSSATTVPVRIVIPVSVTMPPVPPARRL